MDSVSRETWARERERAYVALLRAAKLNLVSARDLEVLEDRHLPESRAFIQGLPDVPTIVDVGSGGGLPGLVGAIWRPDTDVMLVESRGRKAAWLGQTVATLELTNVQVVHGRAEGVVHAMRRGCVTARAVAPLPRLLTFVEGLVRGDVTLHAIKGRRWRDELAACEDLEAAGWRVVATPDAPVPGYRTGPVEGDEDPHPTVVILQGRR